MRNNLEDGLTGGVPSPGAHPFRKSARWPRRTLLLLLQWGLPAGILAVLGYLLFSRLSFAELVAILSNAEPRWLLVGLMVYLLTNVVRAARMVHLLGLPSSRTLGLVPSMFVVSLFNNVLPMRTGELSFPYLMQKDGIEYGSSLAALLVARLFDLFAVCSLFVVGAASEYGALTEAAVGLAAVCAGTVMVLLVVLASLPSLGKWCWRLLRARVIAPNVSAAGWRAVFFRHAEKAAAALGILRSRDICWAAVHSILIWLCTYAWFACFMRGIGLPENYSRILLGASLAALSKSLPIGSFGGFGTHEAGWTLGFTMLGQEVSTAILGGFAVNLLTLLVSAGCGLSSLAWLALRSGRSLRSYLSAAIGKPGMSESGPWRLGRLLKQHRAMATVLALFVALGTLYSVVTPLFETPDEVWHYLYVKHFADGNGLPVYQEGVEFPMRQEASQPPLYYVLTGWATAWVDTSDVETVVQYNPHAALGAPSAWGNRNITSHTPYEDFPYRGTVLAAHLSRFLSVLMGAGTALCTYGIARRLFPHPAWLAPAAAALNAFIPQFIFINASTNNDVLATLLSALCLWLLVRVAQEGTSVSRLCALGVVLGLAALSKLNALVLLPLAGTVLIALASRRGCRWAFIRWGFWMYATAATVGGWWYARNWMLYGDPLGLDLMFVVMPQRAQRPGLGELLSLLDGALKSFFGVFGWFNVVLEPWMYWLFEVGLVLAILGMGWFVHKLPRQRRPRELMRVGLLMVWSGTFVLALVGWTQARYPQGRLLFPAMPAISILCVLGLAQWLPKPYARTAITVLLALLAGFAALVPHRYIAPAYARAEPLSEAERAAIANPMSVAFGGQVCLLGYDLVEATLRPGTTLWLTVYWQGLTTMERDYSVFVHLVDARGVIVSQRDSYPGSGNDPTRGWTPGRAMRDHFPLQVPLALLAQGPLRIRLGLYEFATGQRLSIVHSAEEATDFVELPVALSSQGLAPPVLTDLDLEFGGVIALTGYSVEPLTIQPGDQLRVSLRWQAREDVNEDYTVFAQLLREGDQIWGQYDHVPGDGQSPTSKWDGGLAVMDEFALPVFPGAPQDTYELIVGLYRSTTVERLRLADGTDRAVLGRIVVKHE